MERGLIARKCVHGGGSIVAFEVIVNLKMYLWFTRYAIRERLFLSRNRIESDSTAADNTVILERGAIAAT